MNDTDIHTRLAAVGRHLSKVEDALKSKANPSHHVTNRELRSRYSALCEQVARDEAADEAHGQHVSDLEHSVRLWLARLESDTA